MKIERRNGGIDMMPYLCDERKRNALIRQQLGRTKVHPKYGRIPDNKGMAFYLIETQGAHIPAEIIKAVAGMFGYNYAKLQRNYDVMARVEIEIFEELGKEKNQ